MTTTKDLVLYKRPAGYIPRVAAVHDLCGYGTCSLGVAIPVLSAGGCDVCAVPTSLFSATTYFPHFYVHDTTPILPDYLDAWQQVDVALDAIYSGFLGSAEEVAIIQRLYDEYPSALRCVDPVMGDAGKKYPTYTDEMCEATKGLVSGADLLLPNLTEASILTGIGYVGQDVSPEYVRRIADALLEMGARTVVLKGIARGDGLIRNYVIGRDIEGDEVAGEELPFLLGGTGDLYASGLLAAVMTGRSLHESVEFAGRFVLHAMRVTPQQPGYKYRGVCFQSALGDVTDLLR